MIALSLTNAAALFYVLGPNGQQLEKVGKIAKEVVPYTDDVVRIVSKNKGFLASIPIWVWIIVGIVVVVGIVYYIHEEC